MINKVAELMAIKFCTTIYREIWSAQYLPSIKLLFTRL